MSIVIFTTYCTNHAKISISRQKLIHLKITSAQPSYLQDLCVPVTTVSTLQLVETLSSLVPDDGSATGHIASPVPQHGTACSQTFELLLMWPLSRIYSRLICLSSHITQHKFRVSNARRPYSDFMVILQCLINCRCRIITINQPFCAETWLTNGSNMLKSNGFALLPPPMTYFSIQSNVVGRPNPTFWE